MGRIKLIKVMGSGLIAILTMIICPIGASGGEWKEDSNGWWYVDGSSFVTGEKFINGHNYYFDTDGYMKVGWKRIGSNWHYFDTNGYMKTGWIEYEGKSYYLNQFGYMETNKAVDGWYLNGDGVGTKCSKIGEFEIDKASGTIVSYKGKETSLVIPRQIEGIEIKRILDKAFQSCKDLTSITIPNSVEFIHPYAFVNCDNLKSIIVDDDNEDYTSFDGVLFNKSMTSIIKYPKAKENISYIIPYKVRSIGDSAFEGSNILSNITFVNDSTYSITIGKYAFNRCENAKFYVSSPKMKEGLIERGVAESKIVLNY